MRAPARSRKIQGGGLSASCGRRAGRTDRRHRGSAGRCPRLRNGRSISSSRRMSMCNRASIIPIPDRSGAPALRIGRLVDDAALEHQLGPVFHRVVAGGRGRGPTQNKQQHGSQGFHGGSKPRSCGGVEAAVDVVAAKVPQACAAVLVLPRHEHPPPWFRRARARARLEACLQHADRPAVLRARQRRDRAGGRVRCARYH